MFLRFKKRCKCKGLSTPPRLSDREESLTGDEIVFSGSNIKPPVCLRCFESWSVVDEDSISDRTHEECCDCLLEKVDPPQCLGHVAGPSHCNSFKPIPSDIRTSKKAIYGYCPICGAKGKFRERRADGNDLCDNGCQYPSKEALKEPMTTYYDSDGRTLEPG
jgi:hypothetical protein